jgi:hypothetical protein
LGDRLSRHRVGLRLKLELFLEYEARGEFVLPIFNNFLPPFFAVHFVPSTFRRSLFAVH